MSLYSASDSQLSTSNGARRYFQQFLGETHNLTENEQQFIPVIEDLKTDNLTDLCERSYEFLLADQKGNQFTIDSIEGFSTDSLDDVFTIFYVALVGLVADELTIERPLVARETQGLLITDVLPPLAHDHLVLVGRFTLDAVQARVLPSNLADIQTLIVDRLSSLVELASQAMMGGDVDPFETFEHRDCNKCGHLLQCHVGFETWTEVQNEHDQWCPGAKK
jgi:hypothetical protein